ncbi:hypothetical protein [Streptomyces sp. NPDC001089]
MARNRGMNNKGLLAAGGMLAVVVGLTAYVALSGGDDGGSPEGKASRPSATASGSAVPTYQVPDDWTEPARWAALPRGQKSDKYGSQTGFPHSTEGALGMMAAAQSTDISQQKSTVDEHLRVYHSYVAGEDLSESGAERVELGAQQTDKSLHQQMGVDPSSPLPSGAYLRTTMVGYKLIKQSPDEVSVWLLSRVSQKAGESAKETVSYTRNLMGVRWESGDWKLSTQVTQDAQQATVGQAKPAGAAPGDKAFNTAGWTALREAS